MEAAGLLIKSLLLLNSKKSVINALEIRLETVEEMWSGLLKSLLSLRCCGAHLVLLDFPWRETNNTCISGSTWFLKSILLSN